MDLKQKRIEHAWKACKGWITEFDGAPTETYFANISADGLPQAIGLLGKDSRDFRVSTVTKGNEETSRPIDPESIAEDLSRLQAHQIAGININWAVELGEQDLDCHMMVEILGKQKFDLEIVWWADQVFIEEDDSLMRFNGLMSYFIRLQELFGAPKVYVGPETLDKPGPGSLTWIEI